jgi:hypothetical protein
MGLLPKIKGWAGLSRRIWKDNNENDFVGVVNVGNISELILKAD